MTDLMIEAHDLGRTFGSFVAVSGVELEVPRGEVFGVLGPNGAGKTTTMRLLTGLVAATSGTARIAGFSTVTHAEEVRRRVGILTETPGVYPRLSAIENLRFFARLYEVRDRETAIRRWLERLELWDRRDAPAGSLSKGMRQKLALARALLHDPEVVFLDEPTSALDPESARGVRDIVAELRDAGRTIVLCTHNLDEVERLADRIGIMKRTLLHVARPSELKAALYRRRFRLKLDVPRDRLAAIVGDLPAELGIGAARVLTDDVIAYEVEQPERVHPALVRWLVGRELGVVSLEEEPVRLEDIYLDIVHRAEPVIARTP